MHKTNKMLLFDAYYADKQTNKKNEYKIYFQISNFGLYFKITATSSDDIISTKLYIKWYNKHILKPTRN